MTTSSKPPRAPAGLARRGARFWRRVVGPFHLDDAETELLVEVCRALDECEALHAVVDEQGRTVAGSRGQVVAHPALSELRQTRLMLGRLLAQLELPDEDGDALRSPLQARGRRAATSRWGGARRGTAS
ncbi:MAG: terminase [Nocardioidaceae bacterium]|nr:terminase [Nocardioidaceae bacterium]